MIKVFLNSVLLFVVSFVNAQKIEDYHSLDQNDPIILKGDYIVYQNDTIPLGPKAFFIDGQLTDEQVAPYPYVFNSVNEAAEHLIDGSEESPMVLYLAPYVYWIDDPDDPAIRVPKNDRAPYGLVIECEWLTFYGLSENASNVVLACNRGQTIGSRGNFTLFKFVGEGTSSENITFGNYCNIDLEFPLKPELNREKRASAIVQAQLIHCNGDKIVARNTRFVSRLNLCPFVGGKRVLFDRCHFESTDDALCGTGVYLNSTFDFYSSKPFYWTRGTGSVFLNCDITSYTRGEQYFTKANGQLALLDTRIKSESLTYLGWQSVPPPEMRNYQYNISLNSQPVFIGTNDPDATVTMDEKKLLDAYRFNYQGKVVYNTYNLLQGNDDWDPMGIKPIVLKAEKENGTSYSGIPTQLLIEPSGVTIETGKDQASLTATLNRFGNFPIKKDIINWKVAPEMKGMVELKISDGGYNCTVVPANNTDNPIDVIVVATTTSGLEAASVLTVLPSKLDPPRIVTIPEITTSKNGFLSVDYQLDSKYEDQSLISWYRCTDADGSNPIKVAVSRFNKPLFDYELNAGDIGYFIMASISPKHIRCDAGKPVNVMFKREISKNDVKSDNNRLKTDFRSFPTDDQANVLPGFWTLDSFNPEIIGRIRPADKEKDAWYYGEGRDGAANMQGLLQAQNASLFYTPVNDSNGDICFSMEVSPYKTAGQGFSIAHLYMDVLIQFDAKTLSGYGLRFIRTTKYHNAVDCFFVKYTNGQVEPISEAVSTTCYRTPCLITVETVGNTIKAQAKTENSDYKFGDPNLVKVVDIETEINPGTFGGIGIRYAGGAPSMINSMKAEWK